MNYGLDPYGSIGLTESPFQVHALSPDEKGERLLVGRDDVLRLVSQRLHKHGKITCLDGHVGVGKTSLVNVAAYKCFKAYLAGETTQLLIPSVMSYQLKKDGNVDQFCTEVFHGIAQTLVRYAGYLQHFDKPSGLSLPQLNAWLNSPIVQHRNGKGGINASIGIAEILKIGGRGEVGTTNKVKQSDGFDKRGGDAVIGN